MSIREKAYFERRVCYCCERDIVTPHKFYSEMCESCGELKLSRSRLPEMLGAQPDAELLRQKPGSKAKRNKGA